MEEIKNITRSKIEESIKEEFFSINKKISLMMAIGPSIYFFIVYYLYTKNEPIETFNSSYSNIDSLTIVFASIIMTAYIMFFIVPKNFLNKSKIELELNSYREDQFKRKISDPVVKLLGLDRTLMIIKLALLEAPSLAGLVFITQKILNHSIYNYPLYWLFTIPLLILIFIVFTNFISKEKLILRIEEMINIVQS